MIPFISATDTLTALELGFGWTTALGLGLGLSLEEEDEEEDEDDDEEEEEEDDEDDDDDEEEPCLSRALSLRWPLEPRLLLPDELLEDAEAGEAALEAATACFPADITAPLISVWSTLPFCSLDLTISCFASDVLVPGLVRLIFILRPLSVVAECSMCILAVAAALEA